MSKTVQFKRVQFTSEDIGPHLLESITKGLYVNPLHTIREYAQNEIEAEPPATFVKVHIGGNEISIYGDGGGMNKAMILGEVKKIGFSRKDPTKHFGFRGIGIWSGIAVCNTIMISTKRKDEPWTYSLRVNAKNIREEIKKKKKPLIQVLTENVELAEISTPHESLKHGTHVRLLELLDEARGHLTEEKVREYLSRALPLGPAPDFVFRHEVEENLSKNVPNYRVVNVFLGDKPVYRAPFTKDLDPPKFMPIKDGHKNLAYCWYCMNEQNQMIADPESRGIIYKKFGFTVGGRDTCLNWWRRSPHLANWCVGEVHVIDPNILPNSERMDFESGPEKERLVSKLVDLQSTIEEESRKKSFFIRIEKNIDLINGSTEKPDFTSTEEKARKIAEVAISKKHLDRSLRQKRYIEYADSKTKEKMTKAIDRASKLIECYMKSPPLEYTAVAMPSIEVKPKEVEPIVLPPKQQTLTLLELLKDLKLELSIVDTLEVVDSALNEYFADDIERCFEIKKRIADRIREEFS